MEKITTGKKWSYNFGLRYEVKSSSLLLLAYFNWILKLIINETLKSNLVSCFEPLSTVCLNSMKNFDSKRIFLVQWKQKLLSNLYQNGFSLSAHHLLIYRRTSSSQSNQLKRWNCQYFDSFSPSFNQRFDKFYCHFSNSKDFFI